MSDLPPFDSSSNFVRALVRSARLEEPTVGAKARALTKFAAAGGLTGSAAAVGVVKGSLAMWSLGAAAAAALVTSVAVWRDRHDERARPAAAPANAPVPGVHEIPPSTGPQVFVPSTEATAPSKSHALSACERVRIADHEPTVCSEDSARRESLELVNTCGATVDVFWVDYRCRETFTARVLPGETFRQNTYDTHPWRVRDHQTHHLIKEFVGPRQPDLGDAGPIALPDVVITDNSSAEDVAPPLCWRSGRPGSLRFSNQRTRGVSVLFSIDSQCKEQVRNRLEPGETWTTQTFEPSPWRVRDETGALLVDVVPSVPDSTVYVALP
jgi:hypothetical protein